MSAEDKKCPLTTQTVVETMHAEGAGMMTISVYTPSDMLDLMRDGERETLQHIGEALCAYYMAQGGAHPKLCFCCGGAVPIPPAAVVQIVADCDNPSMGLAGVVCRKCNGDKDEMARRAFKAFCKQLPVERAEIIAHEAGHA